MAEMTRRDVLKIAAAGAAASLPALPQPARAQTTQKRELIVAQGGDIAALDPHLSTSSNDIRISFNIFGAPTESSCPAWRRNGSCRVKRRGCSSSDPESNSTTATRSRRPT